MNNKLLNTFNKYFKGFVDQETTPEDNEGNVFLRTVFIHTDPKDLIYRKRLDADELQKLDEIQINVLNSITLDLLEEKIGWDNVTEVFNERMIKEIENNGGNK